MKDELKRLLGTYYADGGFIPENLEEIVDSIKLQVDSQIDQKKVLTVDYDSLRDSSLMIATPFYGGQLFEVYHTAITKFMKAAQEHGLDVETIGLSNESLIQRGRNTLANEFMGSRYEYLMFIDADIGFSPSSIFQLWQQKKKIIGAPYAMKTLDWEKIKRKAPGLTPEQLQYAGAKFAWNPFNEETQIERYKLAKVKNLATGFLMIHRDVFEKFQTQFPNYRYRNNHLLKPKYYTENPEELWMYFHTEVSPEDSNTYLSEDYWFCRKALDMGFDIHMAPWIQLIHRGTFSFTGDFITAMSG